MTAMRSKKKRRTWLAALAALVALASPAVAGAGSKDVKADAVLYEVTENMYFYDALGGIIPPLLLITGQAQPAFRVADATLLGTANLGNPLCPSELLVTNPKAKTCTVTAAGQDNVSLATGRGSVEGTYAVVLNVDNHADEAEYVVQTGSFSGEIDLSTRPLGTITGTFRPTGTDLQIPFSGTFRLPFSLEPGSGKHVGPKAGANAYYLADDGKTRIKVKNHEHLFGKAMVRLEINF